MTVERMIELLEIEKECVLRNAIGECNRYCAGCDLLQDDTELHEMYTEAIALLKAQVPRVMTLKELSKAIFVYIETRSDKCTILTPAMVTAALTDEICVSFRFGTRLIDSVILRSRYMIDCRCWTSRPTKKQRMVTPWQTM